MNYLNDFPNLIADQVKISLGSKKLLNIDDDRLLRSIVLDAAGHVIGVIVNRIRDGNNASIHSQGTTAFQGVISEVSKNLFEKALDESTISQAITLLKTEQKNYRNQITGKNN